jgi:hypothetical protein
MDREKSDEINLRSQGSGEDEGQKQSSKAFDDEDPFEGLNSQSSDEDKSQKKIQ